MNIFEYGKKKLDNISREGLSELQAKRLNREKAAQSEIFELVKNIHIAQFPEEYDFMLDDHVDAAMRKKGINPMNSNYIERVARKRAKQGVQPLSDSGASVSNDSFEICYKQAKVAMRGGTASS
ncbi:MAG: hypothetical protein DRQ62_14150 [Gammaproteobacteria bacterium]|nr:MAG: hypothetical protein DRQ62_14150 [Gammaproteobacteria bacterium]